jgi:hypothetical protein
MPPQEQVGVQESERVAQPVPPQVRAEDGADDGIEAMNQKRIRHLAIRS